MIALLALLQSVAGTEPTGTDAQRACAYEVGASATAFRLSELPQDVRDEMKRLKPLFGDMADSNAPLLQSDAPAAAERDYPTVRFAQAMLVKDRWFVQFEVSLFAGVRTTSFTRHSDGHFRFSPSHYFGGPACASIKAAVDGVTTPFGPYYRGG